jgi:hypothetical protein
MGWVDLWRGILICDLLREKPKVCGVPLPVPMELLKCNYGRGADIGSCGRSLRGITVINQVCSFGNHCLDDLQVSACCRWKQQLRRT